MFNKTLVWPNFPGKIDGNLETTNQKYETKPNINEKGKSTNKTGGKAMVNVTITTIENRDNY
ncbi:hypothetical protein DERF_011145 [Dermatophagoides farinae]|uniref:Uncharacterized protein n=1 Tax=Dermatophagoides farinae TaxID=6954 RepID=A0A922L2T6_DERFA|nr:hypothetical protein DERF_011145 [Dermatophagoides farinae]